MGFPLQVVNKEQASPMPLRVHAGAAYEVAHHFAADSSVAVWLSTDLVSSPRTHAVNVNAAAEVGLDNTIFLRAGWASGSGLLGGAGVGVGLRYDRFEVDVAKAFVASELDVEGPIHVTFAIRF
jgi:hypothetical protein